MRKLYDYLDRYFLKNAGEKCQSLTETALSLFKKKIFEKRKFDLTKAILNEIYKDRENEIVDKDLIKDSVNQFIYMGYEKKVGMKKVNDQVVWNGEKNLLLYDKDFESQLKEATQ